MENHHIFHKLNTNDDVLLLLFPHLFHALESAPFHLSFMQKKNHIKTPYSCCEALDLNCIGNLNG